ncbi:MAG: prepilin-type N-terminal cleavage/methylation domain-containing protein [Planctomycetes bacterium]|nr:prepilin-type N-terminal cleavage/methylation domain-containing protein [Planctomycetota bacterium]
MAVGAYELGHGRRRSSAGFTLLEICIVAAVLAILVVVAVPQYASALRTARIGKAKHDLVTIASAVDQFTVTHGGVLPASLHQVGFGGRLDPWGAPYCYLNYGTGCGDGLQWAIDAGLVDPDAFRNANTSLGQLGDQLVAVIDKRNLGFSLFVGVDAETTRRRDRYMFPLNTDYDLFSLGPDCRTAVSLGEAISLDDVIRANNGGFFGLAADY